MQRQQFLFIKELHGWFGSVAGNVAIPHLQYARFRPEEFFHVLPMFIWVLVPTWFSYAQMPHGMNKCMHSAPSSQEAFFPQVFFFFKL